MAKSKQFMVVAYDISSDRRRLRVAKILAKYGTRANYSVFECMLSPPKVREMKAELQKALKLGKNNKNDNILFYYLCPGCVGLRARIMGEEPPADMVKVL